MDGYIQLKLNLEKLQWQQKVQERKAQIERLRRKNESSNERRAHKNVASRTGLSNRPTVRVSKVKLSTTRQTPRGSLFKGTTFDLMYSLPPAAVQTL